MTGRLVAVGNVVVDVTLLVPRLPVAGSDVLGRDGRVAVGGSAWNVMAAARHFGAASLYAGAHGTGPFGDLARDALHLAGIGVAQRATAGADTGFVVVLTDDAGERTFLTCPGAEATLDAEALAAVRPGPADVVHVSGYVLTAAGAAAAVAAWVESLPGAVTVLVDPGPLVGELPAAPLGALLRRADWWRCTLTEAASLLGTSQPGALAAAASLARRTGRVGVLVSAGPADAALALRGRDPVAVPVRPVDVVDTNAAGDTQAGVLAAGLLAGLSPLAAVRRATDAAAQAVGLRGPVGARAVDRREAPGAGTVAAP